MDPANSDKLSPQPHRTRLDSWWGQLVVVVVVVAEQRYKRTYEPIGRQSPNVSETTEKGLFLITSHIGIPDWHSSTTQVPQDLCLNVDPSPYNHPADYRRWQAIDTNPDSKRQAVPIRNSRKGLALYGEALNGYLRRAPLSITTSAWMLLYC